MNKKIVEILDVLENHGHQAYIVGGYVRDFLLGKTTNDIDICTDATTKELLSLFPGNANEYGSFNLKINDFNIDITTFRKEENYQLRHPTSIVYINDLKTDLLRRDFTVNAICMDKQGKIIDELNGIKDLEAKTIRMIGDTKEKIIEDPLRILRAIRFATVLDFSLETTLQEEIKNNKSLLKTLSGYRVKEEIDKILLSTHYKEGLRYLKKFALCEELGLYFTNVQYTNDLCGMWAQIDVNDHLPFTKTEKENIVKIQEILRLKVIEPDVLYQYGLYLSIVAGEILGISKETIHEMNENLPIYSRKDLKLSYLEICEILGLKPSKKVKKIETLLIHEVLVGHVLNEKEDLQKYLLTNKARWGI